MLNIAVFVSGSGTNFEALCEYIEKGAIKNARITTVISSTPNAYALQRAQNKGIVTHVVSKKTYTDQALFDQALLERMESHAIDLVVLAGYLSMLGPLFVKRYENRIINVHPALIPSFCGKGYYGRKVHEKALEYGVKITGATVHFVDADYDTGPIILQKAVDVLETDTPQTLQKRVMEQAEWIILPKAVKLFCEGRLIIRGRVVSIEQDTKETTLKGE